MCENIGYFETRDEAIQAYYDAYDAALEGIRQEALEAANEAANEAATAALEEAEAAAWEAYYAALEEAMAGWVEESQRLQEEAIIKAKEQAKEEGKPWYCLEDIEFMFADLPVIPQPDLESLQDNIDSYLDAFDQAYQEALDTLSGSINDSIDLSDFLDCVDEFKFEFDMSEEEEEKVRNTLRAMNNNCFYKKLLNLLEDYGVKIAIDPNLPSGIGGKYDPATNTVFLTNAEASMSDISAELFHAQQNNMHGDLQNIVSIPPNTGGSNIEFEETLMSWEPYFTMITTGEFPQSGWSNPAGMEGVDNWILDLIGDNGGTFPTDFTPEQKLEYLNFVEQFRQHHENAGTPGLRSKPVDSDKDFPDTLTDILNKSDCNE